MIVRNYLDGEWCASSVDDSDESIEVTNPATAECLREYPLGTRTTSTKLSYRLRALFPSGGERPRAIACNTCSRSRRRWRISFDAIAETITRECGKTFDESKGELRRAIENVEVACGIPTMMLGSVLEDVASGIDEMMIRQPVGVVAVIAPFNFSMMIPFWFLPYAIACGNTVVVKPSEKVPLTMQKVFELLEATGLPKGRGQSRERRSGRSWNAIPRHPGIHAVSFVGSTAIARHVYSRAAAAGKRVQCQGGAKNPVIVLPDADIEMTTRITADSAFGCAGQRCLAALLAITRRRRAGEVRGVDRRGRVDARCRERARQRGRRWVRSLPQRANNVSKPSCRQGVDEGAGACRRWEGASVSGYKKATFSDRAFCPDYPPKASSQRRRFLGRSWRSFACG